MIEGKGVMNCRGYTITGTWVANELMGRATVANAAGVEQVVKFRNNVLFYDNPIRPKNDGSDN